MISRMYLSNFITMLKLPVYFISDNHFKMDIDASEKNIKIARLHSEKSKLTGRKTKSYRVKGCICDDYGGLYRHHIC